MSATLRDIRHFIETLPPEALDQPYSTLETFIEFARRHRAFCADQTQEPQTGANRQEWDFIVEHLRRLSKELGCARLQLSFDPSNNTVNVITEEGRQIPVPGS